MITTLDERRGHVPVWTFAERIRKVRRDLGMTQEEFSARLGVGIKRYSAWETGKNKPSDLGPMIVKLERVTGVPKTWFMGWMDENAPDPGDGVEGGGADDETRTRNILLGRAKVLRPEFGAGFQESAA